MSESSKSSINILIKSTEKLLKRFNEQKGIIDAYNNIGSIKIPIIIRLQGTNAQEAKDIIDNSGLEVVSAVSLQSAADKVKEVLDN